MKTYEETIRQEANQTCDTLKNAGVKFERTQAMKTTKKQPLRLISEHSLRSPNAYDHAHCIADTTHIYVCFVQGHKEWQGVFSIESFLGALLNAQLVQRVYENTPISAIVKT